MGLIMTGSREQSAEQILAYLHAQASNRKAQCRCKWVFWARRSSLLVRCRRSVSAFECARCQALSHHLCVFECAWSSVPHAFTIMPPQYGSDITSLVTFALSSGYGQLEKR